MPATRRRNPPSTDEGESGSKLQLAEDTKLRRQGYWFDGDEANRFCTFMERYVRHYRGPLAGKTVILEPWQRTHLRRLFGWRRPDGTRRYRTAGCWMPRKNGKSLEAVGVGHFGLTADGELGAEIYSLGCDRKQAGIVFDDAKRTVVKSPDLQRLLSCYKDSIVYPNRWSSWRALSGKPSGKTGFNPHMLIADELHEYKNRAAFDAMTTGSMARRQPLFFQISTVGIDTKDLWFEAFDYARKLLDGVHEDHTYLPVMYAAGADDDWTDEDVWRKANPNLGVSFPIEELRTACEQAQKIPGKRQSFRQFHLNQIVNDILRWLPMDKWVKHAGPTLKVGTDIEHFAGRECWCGLDLSKTTDLTALVLCFPGDNDVVEVLARFWVPEETILDRAREDRVDYPRWAAEGWIKPTPGNVVDYRFIRHEIVALSKVVTIREIGFDKAYAFGGLVQALKDEDGLSMVEVPQSMMGLCVGSSELERRVVAGKIRDGGNAVLRWNASNAVARVDSAGNVRPDKGRSTERIDGIVALVMAIGRLLMRQGPSIYETEGITVI